MRIRADQRDLWGGILLALFFSYFLYGALGYSTGTLRRMGPGFLPLAYSSIGLVLSVGIALNALGRSGEIRARALRPALAVFASIAAYALLLPRTGLVPTAVVVVATASLAARSARLHEITILAAGAALASWVLFILLLRLPMPAYRWAP